MTGAGATIAWALLIEPHLGAVGSAPWTDAAVGTSFAALLTLALAVCTTGLVRTVTPASVCVFAAGGLLLATVPLAAVGGDGAPYARGGIVDVLWLAAITLCGAAALHPSMTNLGAAEERRDSHLPRAWIGGLVALALVPASMLAVDAIRGGQLGMLAAIAISIALVVLVVLRLRGVLEFAEAARSSGST